MTEAQSTTPAPLAAAGSTPNSRTVLIGGVATDAVEEWGDNEPENNEKENPLATGESI